MLLTQMMVLIILYKIKCIKMYYYFTVCVCACMYTHAAPQSESVGSFWKSFSPSPMCAPATELKSSGLVASDTYPLSHLTSSY